MTSNMTQEMKRDVDSIHISEYNITDNFDTCIVFLHGYAAYPEGQDNILKYLIDSNIPLYAPNLIGHGHSGGLRGNASVKEHIESMTYIINIVTEKFKKIIFVCNSLSSCIGFYILKNDKQIREKVTKWINIAPYYSVGLSGKRVSGMSTIVGNYTPTFVWGVLDYILSYIPLGFSTSACLASYCCRNKNKSTNFYSDPLTPKTTPIAHAMSAMYYTESLRYDYHTTEFNFPVINFLGVDDEYNDMGKTMSVFKSYQKTEINVLGWSDIFTNSLTQYFDKNDKILFLVKDNEGMLRGSHEFYNELFM